MPAAGFLNTVQLGSNDAVPSKNDGGNFPAPDFNANHVSQSSDTLKNLAGQMHAGGSWALSLAAMGSVVPSKIGPDISVDGYKQGSPERPDISWDSDFSYNPEAKPELGDYASWKKWGVMLSGATLLRPDLDDALDFYSHYRENTDEARVFDYEEAMTEDTNIAFNINQEITRTAAAVDKMTAGREGQSFAITGEAHSAKSYPKTENWQKTIGAYYQWSSANVTIKDGMVTMEITVHAEDKYNFNRGQYDIATDTPDNVNGRFEELGWAKGFETSGSVTRTISWPVGHPPSFDDITAGTGTRGTGTRDRGGEDRADR